MAMVEYGAPWTEQRIEQLTRLWADGLPTKRIAQIMGGVTSNAVIGKAHRLNLPRRPNPVKSS